MVDECAWEARCGPETLEAQECEALIMFKIFIFHLQTSPVASLTFTCNL